MMVRATLLFLALASLGSCDKAEERLDRVQDELRQVGEIAKQAMQDRMDSWREDLVTIDVELAEWKERAKQQAATASAEAQQKLQDTIDALEAKRQDLSAKLLVASQASGEAWDEIAAGFEQGWDELKTGLKDARESTE